MNFQKLELGLEEVVQIHSTTSSELDGSYGCILGKSVSDYIDHYIVLLDEPTDTALAVVIPEVCLVRVPGR